MGSHKPYYKSHRVVKFDEEELGLNERPQSLPVLGGEYIDLWTLRQESLIQYDPVEKAQRLLPKLYAVTILSAIRPFKNEQSKFIEFWDPNKPDTGTEPEKLTPIALASLVYREYSNAIADNIPSMVSDWLSICETGWCGSFGPAIRHTSDYMLRKNDGNDYDMNIMNLIPIAYRYYNELSPKASEHLIQTLMGQAKIRRIDLDDENIAGEVHQDWHLAGIIKLSTELVTKVPELVSKIPELIEKHTKIKIPIPDFEFKVTDIGKIIPEVDLGIKIKDVGETENHILMTATARYLTNQLLYQRTRDKIYDNRRNGSSGRKSCLEQILYLLGNALIADFSEYNSKPYSRLTRAALLNLHNYAYDHEVRLASKIVLDYISARFAVSSNDLRRMVPFRRRNELDKDRVTQLPGGFMDVDLLDESRGADPMVPRFAMLSGNIRAFETQAPFPRKFGVRESWSLFNAGLGAISEVISDYRLPASIHDLFVNYRNRRFYERLHRRPLEPTNITGQNCDNYEIYFSSPSYLISAGGKPSTYAIDPTIAGITPFPEDSRQQIGVAVTTSFIPTTNAKGEAVQGASELIQFSTFSEDPDSVENYGVAPDFAFGNKVHLPGWACDGLVERKFHFVNKRGPDWERGLDWGLAGMESGPIVSGGNPVVDAPGFFLAIFKDGDYCILEAFDCWVHPEVSFQQFKDQVGQFNNHITHLKDNDEDKYVTQNGNVIHFKISSRGANVVRIDYGDGNPYDTLVDAGNDDGNSFLKGNIMNSPESGVVTVSNPILGTTITLDLSDPHKPVRIAENGEVECAGNNNEVWVDFEWTGPCEGDFYHPFNTLAAAISTVAEGGTIKIMPGTSKERINFQRKKFKLVAPIGEVVIGAR